MSACTCAPCGREFTGLGAFDRHQDVDYKRRPPVQCMDPASLGMVQNAVGRWHEPQTDAGRVRLENLRAGRTQAGTPVTPGIPGAAETISAPRLAKEPS